MSYIDKVSVSGTSYDIRDTVLTDSDAQLTDTQKAQARTNIGATSVEETNGIKSRIESKPTIAWTKGLLYASGGIGTTANGGVSDLLPVDVLTSKIYIDTDTKANVAFWNGSTYLGKVAANGSINRTSGDWMDFSGLADVSQYAPQTATGYKVAVYAKAGMTITDDNVNELANGMVFFADRLGMLESDVSALSSAAEQMDTSIGTLSETVGGIVDENYPKTLKNLRESALGVGFDTNVVAFKMTDTGLDITLPYRCYIFGDKTNNIYEKKMNGLTEGSFTISWNLSGYIVLDIATGTVRVDTWSEISARTDPFIVLACSGKRVYINRIIYPFFGAGALLPYYAQYMQTVVSSEVHSKLIPPYYYFIDDYLPDKVVSVRNKAKAADVSFGFITDYHVGVNTDRGMLLMKYMADATNAVPFVLFGGDVPKASGTEAEALAAGDKWLEAAGIFGKENVYQCKGNHDYMISTSESTAYHADVRTDYYYICKPTEHKVHGSPDRLYYYFDDDVNKVRYIVLDNYDAGYSGGNYNTTGMSQEQYDWLIDLLTDDGYDVLVLSHQTSDETLRNYESVLAPLQEILKAFVAKGTLSYTGSGVTLTGDFTNTTSRLICHLSGHSHDDESHVDNGVLSIVSVCDAYYTAPSGYTRTYSTVTEQAFDIFCITKDTGNGSGSIEIVRIGAGNDRSFTY